MKWLTSRRRLADIINQRNLAEARTRAVQLRLARVKAERDELLADIDDQARLAQDRALTLQYDLTAETKRANELAADVTQLRETWTTLCRVEDWLHQVIRFAADAAEAPVFVLVHDGIVHSVHRTEQAARDAAQRADPIIPDCAWRQCPAGEISGWRVSGRALPELECPPRYRELADHYGWESDTAIPAPRKEAKL